MAKQKWRTGIGELKNGESFFFHMRSLKRWKELIIYLWLVLLAPVHQTTNHRLKSFQIAFAWPIHKFTSHSFNFPFACPTAAAAAVFFLFFMLQGYSRHCQSQSTSSLVSSILYSNSRKYCLRSFFFQPKLANPS